MKYMAYEMATATIMNSNRKYDDGSLCVSLGDRVLGIQSKCLVNGNGRILSSTGDIPGLSIVEPDGNQQPIYSDNNMIMGLQSILKQQGSLSPVRINGINIPYVVSDRGPIGDDSLIDFMKDLQTQGYRTDNIAGMRFSNGDVYLFTADDIASIEIGKSPRSHFQHVPIAKGSNVYIILGRYNGMKDTETVDFHEYMELPLDDGFTPTEEVANLGGSGEFSIDEFVEANMSLQLLD
jgi:hypothetical protein